MPKFSKAIFSAYTALFEFLSFHPKEKRTFPTGFFMTDFIVVADTGMYRHATKSGMFCGACLSAHRVYARMNKEAGGWKCFTCGQWYADPGNLPESTAKGTSATPRKA